MFDPCASTHLANAATALSGALAKLQDEATKAEINETLKKLREWSRQAGIEELNERDRQDGIA